MNVEVYKTSYLLSSSTIVTVASPGILLVTLVGSEVSSIVSIKFLLPSNTLLSFIKILNVAVVCPAGIVTVYGPEL